MRAVTSERRGRGEGRHATRRPLRRVIVGRRAARRHRKGWGLGVGPVGPARRAHGCSTPPGGAGTGAAVRTAAIVAGHGGKDAVVGLDQGQGRQGHGQRRPRLGAARDGTRVHDTLQAGDRGTDTGTSYQERLDVTANDKSRKSVCKDAEVQGNRDTSGTGHGSGVRQPAAREASGRAGCRVRSGPTGEEPDGQSAGDVEHTIFTHYPHYPPPPLRKQFWTRGIVCRHF